MHDLEPLRSVPLFESLSDAEFLCVARDARRLVLPPRAIVICQGDGGESLFIIEHGQVRVFVANRQGREMTVDILSDGDFFGELAALTGAPRSASVMTMLPTALWSIGREQLDECVRTYPGVVSELLRVQSQRVRATTELAREIALLTPRRRIARTLAHLAERRGEPCPEGLHIGIAINQGDIADMTGTTRETVNRVLADLRDEGLVEFVPGNHILVRDAPRLHGLQ